MGEELMRKELRYHPGANKLSPAQLAAMHNRHHNAIQPIPSKTALGYEHLMAHEDRGALLAEVNRLNERLYGHEEAVKDAVRTTAAEVVRMLAGWGDDGLTQDELYWLAGRIAAFEGGMCDLCQHVCSPQCPLYPLNDEAQEIEARKETRG